MRRIIVAGSRDIDNYFTLRNVLDKHLRGRKNVTIVSGHARGVDLMAEYYARMCDLPLEVYPADWKKYGNRAGMVRNAEMAEVADELVAILDGQSRGTAAMIRMMRRRKKPVAVYGCDGMRVE